MASVVQAAQAFLPGHDLWFIPEELPKAFQSSLDWYLNFQLSKSQRLEKAKRSPELEKILAATGQNFPPQSSDSAPVVIPSSHLLPCRWVAMSSLKHLESWTASAQQLWASLGKPKVKIFLPEGHDAQVLMKVWNAIDPVQDYVVVQLGAN